jgi:hypothetical protein
MPRQKAQPSALLLEKEGGEDTSRIGKGLRPLHSCLRRRERDMCCRSLLPFVLPLTTVYERDLAPLALWSVDY